MRAVGYLRVSTEEQASSGLGLEAQRAAIVAAAVRLGLELAAVHVDEGLSGSLPPHERPALMTALAELGRGEVLLVAKRDRLARDYVEAGLLDRTLCKKKARVVSAAGEGTEGDDPSSMLQRGIIDLFAEHERRMIGARTKAALKAKRARGFRAGTVPFGFRALEDGRLVDDLEERVALLVMQTRREAGMGFVRICRLLERRGFVPRGKHWYPATVRAVLATLAKS